MENITTNGTSDGHHKIVLYDLPGNAAADVAWSPNTWKARYVDGFYLETAVSKYIFYSFVLNLKGLPYRTIWVEYPDIAQLYETLGIKSRESRDGKPLYGLPVIHDPSTGRTVQDSQQIAYYLEETYPSTVTPPLFPAGTVSLQAMFVDIFIQKISDPLHAITSQFAMLQLPPRSREYYRSRREARYGCRLEEVAPRGTQRRDAVWDRVRIAFKEFHKWMNMAGSYKIFVLGDKLCFADIVVASYLTWFKRLLGEDSPEWVELMAAEDERWSKLMKAIAPWEKVDEEGLMLARLSWTSKYPIATNGQ